MRIERTISGMIGKGSISHNERKFIAENVDERRTVRNIILISDNIKDVYHELFDGALERYNAKQKRNDRKIEDYYEHIRTGKQEKLFHEVIFQIGNKDDMGCYSREGQIARLVLLDFAKEFQERNPQFRVFGSYLHMDEATPHLHIDFVPYMTDSKRGLDTRVSMKQALASRGFVGKGKTDTEYNQWIESEKEELAKIAERYGIIWRKENTHREHLSVLDYKKEMRMQEVVELDEKIVSQEQEIEKLENTKQQNLEQMEVYRETVDKLEEKLQEIEIIVNQKNIEKEAAEEEAEKAKEKALKQEQRLQKITDYANRIKDYGGELNKTAAELMPEPGLFESVKDYRKKKVLPVIREMKDKMFGIYLAYVKIKEKLEQVEYRYDRLKKSNEYLSKEKQRLLEENSRLRKVNKDFWKVKRKIGIKEIELIIRNEKKDLCIENITEKVRIIEQDR